MRKTLVVQHFARFQSNLGNLHISQDICYVRITMIFVTIYRHCANLLNNNVYYFIHVHVLFLGGLRNTVDSAA